MKIVITESQLKILLSEVEGSECPCDDGTYSEDCCVDYELPKIQSHYSDSLNTIKYALDSGIDLKDKASDVRYRQTWENLDIPLSNLKGVLPDEYTTYVPELVSGVDDGFKFDNRLIDILKEVETISGLDIIITGGRDKFHKPKNPGSKHNKGMAVDFVPINGMNNTNDSKIEWAVLDIILSGKYNGIGLINERIYPSGHASGVHFHLSLDESSLEYSNFAFVDKNGNKSSIVIPKGRNLRWGNGGPIPKTIYNKIKINKLKSELKDLNIKDYCEKIINLDYESISILTPEFLPRNVTNEKVKRHCEQVLYEIEPMPLKPIQLPHPVQRDLQVSRTHTLYNQYKGFSKRDLKKELRGVDKDDLELIKTLNNLIKSK
jgi:hypothetical protein